MEQKHFQKTQQTVTTTMLFRVVFSFSIFSLLMFYSSSLLHLHVLRSCKFNFKLYSLPSDTNKNFMFLLCNGILCIIFNTSGLIRPKESQPSSADMDKNKQSEEKNVVAETSEAVGPENRAETEQEQRSHHEGEGEDGRTCDMVVPPVTAVDEEEAEDDEEMLSLEELNKKCDDFIKKMKLEIRFEDA